MAKQGDKGNKGNNQGQPQGGNVLEFSKNCKVEGCKGRNKRAGFCDQHFMWFKEGLITKSGTRPKDFEKKYINFIKKHPEAA